MIGATAPFLARGFFARAASGAARGVLDVLLPPTCATCDAIVPRPGQFCGACFRRVGFVTAPLCDACGRPFAAAAQAGPGGRCADCLTTPPSFARARAALRYDDLSRQLILGLKYADRTEIAATLAVHMARAGAALLRDADLIVPVPLHRSRLRQRRYNQSALLARALGRASGVPVAMRALIRVRPTIPLGEFDGRRRREIMLGAIAVRPQALAVVAGRRVLLIDDVLTTGATASACAEALAEGGARAVDVLVAARTIDRRSSA